MRKIILYLCAFCLLGFAFQTGIYTYNLPAIGGGSSDLSVYQGKKLMIMILPVRIDAENEGMLQMLDSFATVHQSDLRVIAVPGMEDGFTSEQREQLKDWYESKLDSTVFISDGVYTRRTSGSLQHPLFNWLTNSELNENFDIDISGPWHKCFINAEGRLIAVLKPHSGLNGQAVNKVLAMQ